MNQEVKKIIVELKKYDSNDILAFYIDKDEYHVNLNSESSQNDLKTVFSALLEQMIVTTIELDFKVEQDYKSGLYIDVCGEYIKELNREIKQVLKKIPQKADIQIEESELEKVELDEAAVGN